MNRLRSTSSMMCSHCASVVSYTNSRLTSRAPSQTSIFIHTRKPSLVDEPEITCKICLSDTPLREMSRLQECGCLFCKDVSLRLQKHDHEHRLNLFGIFNNCIFWGGCSACNST